MMKDVGEEDRIEGIVSEWKLAPVVARDRNQATLARAHFESLDLQAVRLGEPGTQLPGTTADIEQGFVRLEIGPEEIAQDREPLLVHGACNRRSRAFMSKDRLREPWPTRARSRGRGRRPPPTTSGKPARTP